MKTIKHNLIQGSDDWLKFRLKHHGSSEIAAVMGLSKNMTRNELLKIKKTGLGKEFSDYVQKYILDKGHEVEAMARPIIEALLAEELYPVTLSKGRLSASCDGLTLDETIAWENKQFNQEYFDMIRAGVMPDEHMPQCQQILLVSGAEQLLFTISDGTPEKTHWIVVLPDIFYFEKIIAAWDQFDKDLAGFEPVVHIEKPFAEPVENLPTLSIKVDGKLAIISNLELFGNKLRQYVGTLTKDPQDDQDFSNLEQAVKDLKKAEDALEIAESYALAQISDVDDMLRIVADLKSIARTNRLTSEKLVKNQKEVIKLKILSGAKEKFSKHINDLQREIKGVTLLIDMPDFGGAMKNKRTIASLHEAVDQLLADSKINADAKAQDYREKLTWHKDNAEGYGFLFDLQTLITKPIDDFELIIKTRIDAHKKASQKTAIDNNLNSAANDSGVNQSDDYTDDFIVPSRQQIIDKVAAEFFLTKEQAIKVLKMHFSIEKTHEIPALQINHSAPTVGMNFF